jgi:CspA family cold shock protein
MKTGIISWFSVDKGFGFIKPDDKTKDIFFHYNELKKINLENI